MQFYFSAVWMILLFAVFFLLDWEFYSGFGLPGFWQATAINYNRFGSYADGKCSVVCFHSWWASVFFITGRNTASSYFLCPLLTYLSKIVIVTCRTEGLLVWVGTAGWNLIEKKIYWFALIFWHLFSILVCFQWFHLPLKLTSRFF